MSEILIAAAPLLLLLLSLLLGHYPGCEAIVRLSERLSDPRSRRSGPAPGRRPSTPRSRAASGGLLLALALCGRAPPQASST
jgi:hypothetical protein